MRLEPASFRARRFLHSAPPAAAFTLLELLLATAVGAIVLLVINATFFAALRLHNTTHERIDDDLMVQRAVGIIRKDLAGIMLPANPQATTYTLSGQLTTENNLLTDLDTNAERVSADIYTSSARIDGWTSFSEVQAVAYYLAGGDGDRKNLVRAVTRNLLFASNETTTESQTLLNGVTSAGLMYYDGSSWVDTWDSTTSSTLPSALKFSIVMAARDGSNRSDLAPIELVVPVWVKTTTTAQQEAATSTSGGMP